MKHPFHLLAASPDNSILYGAVSQQLQAFDLKSGKLLGSYNLALKNEKPEVEKCDEVETVEPVVKKAKVDEKNADENSPARATFAKITPQKKTKGPGAPPVKNHVRSLSLSRDGKYVIASTDEDKAVVVLNAQNLELVSRRSFPKRPSTVTTTKDDSTLIMADKFGDIFAVPTTSNEQLVFNDKDESLNTEPILGHVSMLIDVVVGELNDREYIITADRDEHIRVTRFPQSYVIERWCFGHTEFISQLLLPIWEPKTLISGGGDDFLMVWDWTTGASLQKVDIRGYISKYLNEEHKALNSEEDEEITEITVSAIKQIKEQKLIIVLVEATNALLIFKLDEGKLQYVSTYEAKYRIVTFTTTQDNRVIISYDNDVELIDIVSVSPEGIIENIEDQIK
ncbi:YVTN repeat-like/Quino protein amine dehydrogenase, partial [Nadsonia fulvescens var. elongata DSM 6958]